MLVSAGEGFEGFKIVEYKEIVFGSAMSTEGGAYCQSALNKACNAAEAKGGNALVNMNMEVYSVSDNIQEATVYGNAVVVCPEDNHANHSEQHKVNLEAYLPRAKSDSKIAELYESNGYKFVACPRCGTKYKTDVNEKGEIHIKGFDDVDDIEPGLQIYCLRCGTKFTVPGTV